MPDPVRGIRLYCATARMVVLEYGEPRLWQFWDYSWVCPCCWRIHCSECSYTTDGETITISDCGRFGDVLASPGSEAAEKYGCTCPVIDNEYGKGFGEPCQWVINQTCRVHVGSRRAGNSV